MSRQTLYVYMYGCNERVIIEGSFLVTQLCKFRNNDGSSVKWLRAIRFYRTSHISYTHSWECMTLKV